MANELGLRNVCFEVADLQTTVDGLSAAGYGLVGGIGQHENIWGMAYVRGPEGIVVALAERIGWRAYDRRATYVIAPPVGRALKSWSVRFGPVMSEGCRQLPWPHGVASRGDHLAAQGRTSRSVAPHQAVVGR